MKIYIWVIKVMDRVRSRLPWDKYNSGKEESEKSKIWGKKKKKKKKKKDKQKKNKKIGQNLMKLNDELYRQN